MTIPVRAANGAPSASRPQPWESFGEWITAATTLRVEDRTKLAAIIRAKVRRGSDATKAARVRQAMKRITEAFTWGALEEDDYRKQLGDLRAQLAVVERQPDEQRILEATRLAQDIPVAWATASPDQRRRIVWSTFEIIRIREGRIVSVRPKPTTAPLLALKSSILRSRPGSAPGQCDVAGIRVEGIEELLALAEASA